MIIVIFWNALTRVGLKLNIVWLTSTTSKQQGIWFSLSLKYNIYTYEWWINVRMLIVQYICVMFHLKFWLTRLSLKFDILFIIEHKVPSTIYSTIRKRKEIRPIIFFVITKFPKNILSFDKNIDFVNNMHR